MVAASSGAAPSSSIWMEPSADERRHADAEVQVGRTLLTHQFEETIDRGGHSVHFFDELDDVFGVDDHGSPQREDVPELLRPGVVAETFLAPVR